MYKFLARYMLDLVGVQEFRWDKEGKVQGIIIFSTAKRMKIINWEQDFCTTGTSTSS
jgi:hypothetical protein